MAVLNSLAAASVLRSWFFFCRLAVVVLRQRTLLILLVSLVPAEAYADPGFISPVTFLVSLGTSSVAVGDFNADGRLDLVMAIQGYSPDYQGTVSILLGNGDGSFKAPLNYAAGTNPTFVAVGDFNGDGISDLAVANTWENGAVSILLGNGDGTFQTAQSYATGPRALSVAVGDFNGDGKLDLAVSCFDPTTSAPGISILLGNGDGTFQAAQNYPAPHAGSLAVADFNRDGNLDLAIGDSVLLGNGDGTFQTYGSRDRYNTPVVVGDFNGDGIPDVAFASDSRVSGSQGILSVLLGNGDGTFQSPQHYSIGANPQSLVAGDFSGGGHLDLAVADGWAWNVSVLKANGDGTFQAAQTYAVPRIGSLAVGDFNSDGKLDLLTSGGTLLLGNGDGTFPAPKSYAVGSIASVIAQGDFNGDGFPDLAVVKAGQVTDQGFVNIFLGNGDGTFQPGQTNSVGSFPSSMAVSDFNGDGRLDLVVANYSSVSILLGNGDGSFQAVQNYAVERPYSVAVGDFNGDGIPDLAIAASSGNGTLSILLGNGDGTFRAAQDYVVPPGFVAIGDFNGDGILDLAVANAPNGVFGALPGTVSILLGNGDGTFNIAATFAAGLGPVSMAVGDFNGDGKQDIVTTNYAYTGHGLYHGIAESDVRVFLGNGDGTFQAAQLYTAGLGPSSVAIADVNADGIADLVVANDFNTISVLLGNGDGTFRIARNFGAGGSPRSAVIADFNRDGYLDVAAADSTGYVTVLLNAANWGR